MIWFVFILSIGQKNSAVVEFSGTIEIKKFILLCNNCKCNKVLIRQV